MRIGVDATSWCNRRGFGRFTRNVVSHLVEIDADNQYLLYCDERTAAISRFPPGATARPVALSQTPARAATADSRRGLVELARLTRSVRHRDVDLFLFPSVYTYFPVFGVPTVVGVHDLIADELPELTLPDAPSRLAWWLKEQTAVRRARSVFTVSDSSRRLVAERFGLPLEKLQVVPEAPDGVFTPRTSDEVAVEIGPLGLQAGRYLLYAGGISPHKNLETLLDAYSSLRRDGGAVPPLVLVGDLAGDPYLSAAGAVRARIAELDLGEHVLLPGFVSDNRLASLYSGATLVVLPSLAEGFGLPAVEAAACGAPVVLSDLPAHRESLGDAAVFFPAVDAGGLARELHALLGDGELRNALAAAGRERVSRLSWEVGARRLRDVLTEALER